MRIKNTLKNSTYALISYGLLALIALIVRRVFLKTLSIELLGYEGLFGNVFSILALADLGLETVILYRMFPAYAQNDYKEMNLLMSICRYLYKIIGLVIMAVGIALIPLLKYIIHDNGFNWSFVYIVYLIQLVSTVITYFLAYKRLAYAVSQQEYICTKIDTLTNLSLNIIKIFVLITLRSYILYLLCNLIINVISNLIISSKSKKDFKFLNSTDKVTFSQIKQYYLWDDIKNNLFQKVAGTIYGGTDNIVISALLGIDQVGLLANYTLIQSFVTSVITKLLKPFQVTIGNYIYSNNEKNSLRMFRMFDLLSFFVATFVANSFACLFNPFISLWLGDKFLLPFSFVVAFSINQYIQWNHQFLTFYRYSFGSYDLDKNLVAFAAIANIVLSIILAKSFGITGIMIGTVIGQIGFWIGRAKVVYTIYITEKINKYCLRQMVRLVIFSIEMVLCCFVSSRIPYGWTGNIFRIVCCCLITFGINIMAFLKTSEMNTIVEYIRKTLSVIKNRGEL